MEKVFVTEDVIEDIKKSLKYLHDSGQHVWNLYTRSAFKDQELRSNIYSNITNLLNVAYHVHDTLESFILLLPSPPLPSSTITIGNGMKTWLKTLVDLITDFTNLRRTIMNDYVLRLRKRIYKAMGEHVNVSTIMTLFYEYNVVNSTNNNGDYYYMDDFGTMILKKLKKERHESMVLISDGMEKLEKVLFETYVMVQKQVILINGGGGADDQKFCDESSETLVYKENEFRNSWKENFFGKLFAFYVCFILAVLLSHLGMSYSHVDIP